MASRIMWFLVLLLGCACAAPSVESVLNEKQASVPQDLDQDKDLKTAASDSHVTRRFSNWGAGYPSGYSGYSVTGYGTLDDNYGAGRYGSYDAIGAGGYGGSYPGYSGYAGNSGYGGYKGYSGGGYGLNSYGGSGGYGGYGGYGGSSGLNSYYGYNNPNYQGAYHLGYGYYNKRPGYGNIYGNGITPSLVTGYRGYSRR